MSGKFTYRITLAAVATAVALSSGCGDLVDQGRSPAQLAIVGLQAASGAQPDEFQSTLRSDVVTNVQRTINGTQQSVPTIFNDLGSVTFMLILKDQGDPAAPAAPSQLNQITVNRYSVRYFRTDNRNMPGVDVPYPFDSAITVLVPADGDVTVDFELVRHIAKEESPLRQLANTNEIIATIAEVTFYGHDQVGNEVSVMGRIGVNFGNFGDPN